MALPHELLQAMQRPGMYFSPVEFDVATAYVLGFDLACNGGALLGFREWLITKVGYGNNLSWCQLVSHLACPDADSPHKTNANSAEHERAIEVLFGLLKEFWRDREAPQGLRRIFLAYQLWLQRQDWYGPSSPDYIAAEAEE